MQGDKSTSNTEPWTGVQPFLGTGFWHARNMLDRPQQFYPGQTYADFSPETEQALSGITGRAMQGSPLVDRAQQAAYNMLGDYQQNPYTEQVSESIRSKVLPAVQSSFGAAGRTGDSPLAQAAVAREMTNALAPYQFQDFQQQQQNQLAAMGMAPGLADIDYQDMMRLRGVGAEREAQEQRGIQEEMARHDFGQNEYFNRVARYMQLLGQTSPLVGGAGQTTARQSQNPLMTLLGLGATGLGAYFGGGF